MFRTGAPEVWEKSGLKHESQWRWRMEDSLSKSETSSTLEQKQVGQTIVQLAQDKHRSATFCQWG